MARAGMANLILELRRRTLAGTADTTIGATTYWSDDQLQAVLDTYRQNYRQITLSAIPKRVGSGYQYLEYPIVGLENFEENQADSGWQLLDSAGGTAPSYTVNYNAAMITFASDTANLNYWLDCRVYDLNQAAADVWESKASFVASNTTWSSDNHKVEAGEEYKHCMAMAAKWRSKAGLLVAKMVRTDERPTLHRPHEQGEAWLWEGGYGAWD